MVTRNPDTFFNTVSPMKTTIFYAQQTLKTLFILYFPKGIVKPIPPGSPAAL